MRSLRLAADFGRIGIEIAWVGWTEEKLELRSRTPKGAWQG
jgi:hypothetical protein